MIDQNMSPSGANASTRRSVMLAFGAAIAGIGALGGGRGAAAAAGVDRISFAGGTAGDWRVLSQTTRLGDALAPIGGLTVQVNGVPAAPGAVWTLNGVVSNLRYTTGAEAMALRSRQAPLGRPQATHAALIPIRKTPAWWALPQDERRAIYQDRSGHTSMGLNYLPQIARRLHHSHDLGEPFDFLTWFEFAPEHEGLFEQLLAELRATEEWTYVDREIDIRLERTSPAKATTGTDY